MASSPSRIVDMYGRVALQHAEIALGAGDDHHVDVLGADQPLRRDELEVQRPWRHASSASFSALATASSMPPTM